MSSQNPNAPRPRRRIAGERKTQRPDQGAPPTTVEDAETPSAEPLAGSSPTTKGRSEAPPPAAEPTSAAEPESAGPQRGVPWPVMAGLAVLALVLVALAAGPFVDGLGWRDYQEVRSQSEVDEARRTAPAAAERAAAAILAYDYRTLESNRDAAAELMTPEYRKQYLQTFEKLVLEPAVEVKAKVTADVRASGVSLASEDRVEVLLFVNQRFVNTANNGEERTAQNRVGLTMERDGDTWRVDDITSY